MLSTTRRKEYYVRCSHGFDTCKSLNLLDDKTHLLDLNHSCVKKLNRIYPHPGTWHPNLKVMRLF